MEISIFFPSLPSFPSLSPCLLIFIATPRSPSWMEPHCQNSWYSRQATWATRHLLLQITMDCTVR